MLKREAIQLPSKERFAKGDLELVEFDPRRLTVEKGGGAVRAQQRDFLWRLVDLNVITKAHHTAATSFQFHFNRAGLYHFATLNLFGVHGGKRDLIDALTTDQLDSRAAVREVCTGLTPLMAGLVWEVLGLERPLQAWVDERRMNGYAFTRHDARGLLIAALDALARLPRFKQR